MAITLSEVEHYILENILHSDIWDNSEEIKKVKAMNHFVTELGLTDIIAIQERAEILAKSPDHA
jgi:hypothetical protein